MRAEEIIQYSSDKELPFYLIEENVYLKYYISAAFDIEIENQPIVIIFKRQIIKMLGNYNKDDFDTVLSELRRLYKLIIKSFRKIEDTKKRNKYL